MEDELENYKTKCRLCLQRLDRGAVNISDDSSATNDFFRLTNLKLLISSKYSSSVCSQCIADLRTSLDIQQKMINIQQSLYQLDKDLVIVKVESDNVQPAEVKTECFEFGTPVAQARLDDTEAEPEVSSKISTVLYKSTEAEDEGSLSSESENYFFRSKDVGDSFICQLCNIALSNDQELMNHLNSHEEKKKSELEAAAGKERVVCHYCGQVLSATFIIYHIQTHENKINNTPLRCDNCDFECFNKGNIKIHMKKHRKGLPMYKCSYCLKEFLHKWPRTHHERTLHNKEYGKYKCEQCGTKFDTPTGLRNHKQSIHLTGRFTCRFCKIVIFNKGQYNLHVRKHRKKIPCELCSVKFMIGDSYTKHMSTHGPPGYKCREKSCEKKFYSKAALGKHSKVDHGPKKDIACHLCDARFHTEHHLKRNIGRQHVEPRFFCDIDDCNYATKRKEYLAMHLSNHKKKEELLSRVRAGN